MEYLPLGRSDLRVGTLSLGCVTFGREIEKKVAFSVLDRAMERGINLLDTAAVYGGGASESVLGEWLRDRKPAPHPILATKVSGRLTKEHILHSVDESLRRLGTERVDLLQAHNWDPQTPLEETLEAFDRLVDEQKVRWIGCSNWDMNQVRDALERQRGRGGAPLVSVQPIYSLAAREIERDLLPSCREKQIGVLTYSPLGAGFLTGKYRRGGEVPQGTRFDVIPGHCDIYFTDEGFRAMETLRQVAADSGYPMARLALAWVLRRRDITSVLIGARSPQHVDQAFEALELSHTPAGEGWLETLSSRLTS